MSVLLLKWPKLTEIIIIIFHEHYVDKEQAY